MAKKKTEPAAAEAPKKRSRKTAAAFIPEAEQPKAGERVAVYCGTRNLYGEMEVAAKSLIANVPSLDRVWFLTEDDEYPGELPEIIRTVNVSKQPWFPPGGANYGSPWTWMCLMRAALTKVFTGLDRILSLDPDTIVEDDIGELWELPLEGKYFAAVREPQKRNAHGGRYFNFGVVMQNLEALRDGKDDEVIRELNETKHAYPEQDVMNDLCDGAVLKLPGDYNITDFTEPWMTRKVRHYAADRRAMHEMPLWLRYSRMSWERALRMREDATGRGR